MRGSCCGSEFGSKEKSHLFCGINARREKWLTSVERLDAWRDSPVSQPADTCIVCSLKHCEYVSLWIRVNLVEINRIEYNGTITTVKISNKKKKYKFLGKQKKKKSVSWQFFTLQIQMIDAWAKLEFYFTGAPGGCWRPQVTRLNNIIMFLYFQERHADSLIQNQHYQVCTSLHDQVCSCTAAICTWWKLRFSLQMRAIVNLYCKDGRLLMIRLTWDQISSLLVRVFQCVSAATLHEVLQLKLNWCQPTAVGCYS